MNWKDSDKEQIDGLLNYALHGWRTPVLKTPETVGLIYEDIFFPSMDGVPIEGWFIPGESDKLIICNHFWPGNRYGFAGHLDGLNGFGGFEVNFLNYYKHLHDEGYNILTYDFRNHGLSGDANGKTFGLGLFEYRDVIGSLQYVNSRRDTSKMQKGLMAICVGCDATIIGMEKYPDYFRDIKVMIGLQPVSAKPFLQKVVELMKLETPTNEILEYINNKYYTTNGFCLDDLSPISYAKSVTTPTKIFQLRRDFRTNVGDVQAIFDNLGSKDKEIHWIEGSDERFLAYNYFGEFPDLMLEWFAKFFD